MKQLPKVIKKMMERGVSAQNAIKEALNKMGDHPEIVNWLVVVRQSQHGTVTYVQKSTLSTEFDVVAPLKGESSGT